jgi:hypothetical protein
MLPVHIISFIYRKFLLEIWKRSSQIVLSCPWQRLQTNDMCTTVTHRHVLWKFLEWHVSCRQTPSVLAASAKRLSKCTRQSNRRFISFRENIRGCIQKFPDWVDNEIYAYLWYYSLRSNTKGYGGKIHYTDSKNSDTTAPSDRGL